MVRSMQLRCKELTAVVPDMAKSAATILCLGAHHILMGPGSDPGADRFPRGVLAGWAEGQQTEGWGRW